METPPIMPRGERVPMSIFTDMHARAWAFPTLLSVLIFGFLTSRWCTVFGEWAGLSSVLVLYGAHRALGERMESIVTGQRRTRLSD